MSPATRQTPSSAPVGLIAGWGRYPLVIAQALREQGRPVIGVGIRDHVDPAFEKLCDAYLATGVGQIGGQIRFLKRHGATQGTLAGKIHKASVLFRRGGWITHWPDLVTLRTFLPHFLWGTRDRRDDTLLLAVVQAFGQRGVQLLPATDFAPELLVKPAQLTRAPLSATQWKDIEFGWTLAKEMGRLDVGQTVVVKGQAVIAVEAVEGTDACILRAGQLCPAGGFTVVKVAKPQQDMRFDVPTIGLGTLQTLSQAGGRLLAVEAGKTILLDEAEFIATAEKLGIAVIALDGAHFQRQMVA